LIQMLYIYIYMLPAGKLNGQYSNIQTLHPLCWDVQVVEVNL